MAVRDDDETRGFPWLEEALAVCAVALFFQLLPGIWASVVEWGWQAWYFMTTKIWGERVNLARLWQSAGGHVGSYFLCELGSRSDQEPTELAKTISCPTVARTDCR